MNRVHTHTPLLMLAIAVSLVVVAVNFYMHYQVGVSVEHAILARDIVHAEEQNILHEQGLSQTYDSSAAGRARLKTLFIPADQAVKFIETLEAIGPEAGADVTLSSIDADSLEGSAPGTLGSAHAHITAQGSWSAVMRVLKLAESLPYPVTVSDVSLSSAAGTDPAAKKQWESSFDIRIPIIKQ